MDNIYLLHRKIFSVKDLSASWGSVKGLMEFKHLTIDYISNLFKW